ncbi:MAG: Lrp/AsnC ligand binding domain-containing protein [Candidatus Hodarchaeota archaeon]
MYSCMLVECEGGVFKKVIKEFEKFEGVKEAFTCTGRFDIVVLLELKNLKSLGELVLKAHDILGVKRVETLVEVPRG